MEKFFHVPSLARHILLTMAVTGVAAIITSGNAFA